MLSGRVRSPTWPERALALLGLLVAVPGGLGAQAPLRVMTFNIRYGTAADGQNAWPHRRAGVIGTIADHAPHLLGVQEALAFQLDEIGTVLERYETVGVGRDDGRRAGEHAAILVDTARLELVGGGTFWLSDTPEVPGSTHWGNRITRITTWARVVDRLTRDTLRVYNAHWDHESQPSRERSARLMLERIARDGSPQDRVIVLGDFNAGPDNPAFRALLSGDQVALEDALVSRWPNRDWPGTFHGFRGDRSGERIDAILLSRGGWTVRSAGIDERQHRGRWPSDHFAVWAVIERLQ